MQGRYSFDSKLAVQCAGAFSASTGVGCLVSDVGGSVLHSIGISCEACPLCTTLGVKKESCVDAHIYGMTEAERFGGKYIYFCPMGLTCFVSPILGQHGSEAMITVGPFRMVDWEDFVAYELEPRLESGERRAEALRQAAALPYIEPERVTALSELLFMAVGFMNNVLAAGKQLDAQAAGQIQGHINSYIAQLKQDEALPQYPIELEKELIASIAASDRAAAGALLNDLLGHILLYSGGDIQRIKARVNELLVLMSRAAMDGGLSQELSFAMSSDFFTNVQSVYDIDILCFQIADIMNRFIDNMLPLPGVKHVDIMRKAQAYIRQNYAKKITVEDVAKSVYLSPSYFSKMFNREIGCSFSHYLNQTRVDKSKKLLAQNLKLADVAMLVGFEDQSYFTKVFKRITGISPLRYRELGGRLPGNKAE